jgi:endonuclease/exonuclease/phosphatase family metal-dependent hydrolase
MRYLIPVTINFILLFSLFSFAYDENNLSKFNEFENNLDFNKFTFEQVNESMSELNKTGENIYFNGYNNPEQLKVITFNAGMLNNMFYKVANYKQRVKFLIDFIKKQEFDLLLFQEIWNEFEINALNKFAGDEFIAFNGNPKNKYKHGLFMLIRKELVNGTVNLNEYFFKNQAAYETISHYAKGFLSASFQLNNGKTITVIDTHLVTVFYFTKGTREKQVVELSDYMSKIKSDYLVLSGDFNSTPDQKEKVYRPIISNFHFLDTTRAIHSFDNELFTYDIDANAIAKDSYLKGSNNKKTKIDYILLTRNNPDAFYYVNNSELVFTDDLTYPECKITIKHKDYPCKLSDHFGILSTITLF